MSKLTEKVVVEREVTGVIADLVNFVRSIGAADMMSDEALIKAARDFWETQHGEE